MWLCFTLTMPNVGSWNGRWSGEGNYYAVVRNFRSQKAIAAAQLLESYYHYNFGDGWSAGIHVTEVDGKEVRRIKRKSKGFCGYEWMIDSIIQNGKILNSFGEDHG